MSVLFSGGCACGAIRYECSAAPCFSEICYCRDCQRSSGNASAALLGVPVANFTLISGAPKYYRVMGTSAYPIDRGFCPECGVWLAGGRQGPSSPGPDAHGGCESG